MQKEFETEYWSQVYSDLGQMDAVANAADHANYLASCMDIASERVIRLADFGFGLGFLLKEAARKLKPKVIYAVDPSEFAIGQLTKKSWIRKYSHKIISGRIEDESTCSTPFNLGLANSILQYVPDKKLNRVVKTLAMNCRYVYLSVPSKSDYKYMKKESGFSDPWAIQRDHSVYRRLIHRYFTTVSYRLLESKIHFNRDNSMFDETLFRY